MDVNALAGWSDLQIVNWQPTAADTVGDGPDCAECAQEGRAMRMGIGRRIPDVSIPQFDGAMQ